MAPLRFPRILRHYFPPCSLERTRAGTTFGPNSPQSAFHAPCSGCFPGLDAGTFRLFRHSLLVARRDETDQRAAPQAKDLFSAQARSVLTPLAVPCPRFLFRVLFSLSPAALPRLRPPDRNARRRCRPPRRRQARHECAEYRALNRSRPRSPASRMQIRTGRSSPASALSGATRSAQSRTPESLATRHRPHPLSIPGRPL